MDRKPPPPSWAGKKKEKKKPQDNKVKKGRPIRMFGIDFQNDTELKFYQALTNLRLIFDHNTEVVVNDTKKSRSQNIRILQKKGLSVIKVPVTFQFAIKGITYYANTEGHDKHTNPLYKLQKQLLMHYLYDTAKDTSEILEVYDDNIEDILWFIKNQIADGELRRMDEQGSDGEESRQTDQGAEEETEEGASDAEPDLDETESQDGEQSLLD